MAKGIEISNGSPRGLSFNGTEVAQGGTTNQCGLYAVGHDLYLDGGKIAEGQDDTGLTIQDDELYFGGVKIGSVAPPTPIQEGLWIPPTQEASTLNKYTYPSLLAAYDALMSESSYNGTIKKYQYTESNLVETTIKDSKYGNNHTHKAYSHAFTEVSAGSYDDSGTSVADISYPLYHYEFTPTNYTKTFYVQAGIHGNEKDAPQTILRFFDIICNHCNEAAYSRLRPLRDNVRFIVVPVVSPVGFSASPNGSMNVQFTNWDGNTSITINGNTETLMMNMNRNFDFNHAFTLDGAGRGGNYPFQRSEVRHVEAVIDRIGKHNIDYLFDNHDGGDVHKHFWFNYNMDGANAPVMRQALADLIDYEEYLREAGGTDYRRFLSYVIKAGDTSLEYTSSDYTHSKKAFAIPISSQAIADAVNASGITFTGSSYLLHEVIKTSSGVNTTIRTNRSTFILPEETESVTVRTYKVDSVDVTLSVEVGDTITAIVTPQADSDGWIHPNVADQGGYSTGTTSAWAGITEGILASGPEYIGGLFGYTFNAEQMTRSLRIRANVILYAYERINTKGWTVNEDGDYFHFDYPMSMTRQTLRQDETKTEYDNRVVTIGQVYDRWDKLAAANSSYITKSASLGQNSSGDDIYCYTLGDGAKKVLFIGGSMRYAVDAKETEMGMYILAEYLCNDYIVNQSEFLRTLKQNYTIVVLPCIDINSGNNDSEAARPRSLNNSYSTFKKWQVGTNGCERVGTFADSRIFVDWIDEHSDAIALISGGELKTTKSTNGKPDYSTEYMTQVILPMNLTELNEPEIHQWLDGYCSHLESDRGEDAPVVQFTDGATCGDYAFDNHNIPTFFINLNVSQMWEDRKQYAQSQDSADKYMYRNYETGRRIANIVNFILMAGGDI